MARIPVIGDRVKLENWSSFVTVKDIVGGMLAFADGDVWLVSNIWIFESPPAPVTDEEKRIELAKLIKEHQTALSAAVVQFTDLGGTVYQASYDGFTTIHAANYIPPKPKVETYFSGLCHDHLPAN